ncbi:Sas10 C-terminal domain family protein [Babesia bovis T2Bo]|uniref:Sas10 C-terminal domain family protein n=1 Tax=Babesia bovis T2Bo TaxID=484906 RepID=UPI001DA66737|nr:Sas10 C-terminal domain family protein [Babesia bovis T2Bo]EDO07429.2 Sas10 C-terminal domain family protein [Babesia bovis T2Bo]
MARKTVKKTNSKKFKGNETFIPIDDVSEDDGSDAAEFEAMGLPQDVDDDAIDSEEYEESMMYNDGGNIDDSDEEDIDSEAEELSSKKRSSWGKRLGNYYDEGSDDYSDADDLNDRIAEANRIAEELYADVDDEDAELDDVVEQEDDAPPDETTINTILENLSASLEKEKSEVGLPPDFFKMTESEKLDYLENEHTEFIALLKEYRDNVAVVKDQVLNLIYEGNGIPKGCTKDGMEYLDLRNELLLMYVTYLSYYLLLKTQGISIKNHPVINRLLELRIMLDKARPIESRLQFEINMLLDESGIKDSGKSAPKPRPDMLDIESREVDNIYRATPGVPLMETDTFARQQKKSERMEKVVSGRRMLEQAREQQEFDDGDAIDSTYKSKKAVKMMKALLERERYEMENMRRLPMNKMAKKELRAFQRSQGDKQGGILLEDLSSFASDAMPKRAKKSDITVGLNAAAQAMRQDILETEKQRASDSYYKPHGLKKSMKSSTPAIQHRQEQPRKRDYDDELAEIKQHQNELKSSIRGKSTEKSKRKYEHVEVEGKRVAGSDILRNKGLTRVRKKTAGNARVSNRAKYEKKVVSNRSKVGGARVETPGYSGETTGINAKKKKSVTF